MPEEEKPKTKLRLGDDGELYADDDSTAPHEKLKRKAKPIPRNSMPILLTVIVVLLVLVGCLLTLNLITNRLARVTPPVVVAPTERPPTATPTHTPTLAPPTLTPAPTLAPTLDITPPLVGIGERPTCIGMRVGGNERITFDTVYGDDNREIYLLDLSLPAGNNICRLTTDARTDGHPVWHPDGGSVLFNRDGVLWRINVDGSGSLPVLSGTGGQWDDSGAWIVFSGTESGSIEVAAADGSQQRAVSLMPLWDEFEPDCCSLNVSALMPLVVFVSAPRAGSGERIGTSDANTREIFTVNADGTGRTQLTFNGDYDDEPEWSPGGSQIVFTRGRYGFNTDIWTMNADGSNPIQLTHDEATDHSPRWLPDGRIMFVSERERAGAIYSMNADGSQVQPVTESLGVLTFDYWRGGS